MPRRSDEFRLCNTPSMPILHLLGLAIALVGGPQPVSGEKRVVGTWKVDLTSLKMELTPEAKRQLDAQKKVKLEDLKKQLAKNLAPITYTFKANHVFLVTLASVGNQTPQTVQGTWSMAGQRITIKMSGPNRSAPEMELTKDGKRIHTIYRQANFGTGKADLIRK